MTGREAVPGGQPDMPIAEHEGPGMIAFLFEHRVTCRDLSRMP